MRDPEISVRVGSGQDRSGRVGSGNDRVGSSRAPRIHKVRVPVKSDTRNCSRVGSRWWKFVKFVYPKVKSSPDSVLKNCNIYLSEFNKDGLD